MYHDAYERSVLRIEGVKDAVVKSLHSPAAAASLAAGFLTNGQEISLVTSSRLVLDFYLSLSQHNTLRMVPNKENFPIGFGSSHIGSGIVFFLFATLLSPELLWTSMAF